MKKYNKKYFCDAVLYVNMGDIFCFIIPYSAWIQGQGKIHIYHKTKANTIKHFHIVHIHWESCILQHSSYFNNNINKQTFHQVSPKNGKHNYFHFKDKEIKPFENLSLQDWWQCFRKLVKKPGHLIPIHWSPDKMLLPSKTQVVKENCWRAPSLWSFAWLHVELHGLPQGSRDSAC